jgi:hypothetical protein
MKQPNGVRGWPEEDIQSLTAPALVLIGDGDFVRWEYAVDKFRLLGGRF